MRGLIVALLATALIGTGALAAPSSARPAQPGQSAAAGCVTYREANRTLDNSYQSVGEIHRGFGTRGVLGDRVGRTMWRAYRPCRRPDIAFVDVVYVKHAGRWKSIYWVYSLVGPAYRTHSATWSHR